MNWSSLPETPQTSEAMRRAAAGVCGTLLSDGWPPSDWFEDGEWSRDDLARVFVAALKGQRHSPFTDNVYAVWLDALRDPRAALAALLDLLAIPVPSELDQ